MKTRGIEISKNQKLEFKITNQINLVAVERKEVLLLLKCTRQVHLMLIRKPIAISVNESTP